MRKPNMLRRDVEFDRVRLATLRRASMALQMRLSRSTAKTAAGRTITQDEIRAVIDLDYSIQQAVYDLCRRLFEGASVEQGAMTVTHNDWVPLSESRPKRQKTLTFNGLTICESPKRKGGR
jgi:hypothetical protein